MPSGPIRRLDAFSRRWPLAACFGAFGYAAVQSVIDGEVALGVVFGLLALLFLYGLSRVLDRPDA